MGLVESSRRRTVAPPRESAAEGFKKKLDSIKSKSNRHAGFCFGDIWAYQ